MLSYSVNRQLAFLNWIQRGALEIADLTANAIARIIELTEKYRDRPMGLADASLVVLAIQTGIRDIVSLDSDFDIYRLHSPELNLIEILWRKIKYEWLPFDSYKNYQTLKNSVLGILND